MTMPLTTTNDDGLKKSLITSGFLHLIALLFLYFGLPHLMPPLPAHHDPVPFQIVEIADLTNTRVKEEELPKPPHPEPPPPPPQPEQHLAPPPPPAPVEKPPEPKVEALKAAPVPKPKPPEKPVAAEFNKLLNNLEAKRKPAPAAPSAKPDIKAPAQPVASQASALSTRLTMTEEDALRRQISACWNAPIGARDAQNLIVQLVIDVNPDRTVQNTDIVDKARYGSDSFFRAAADSAVRALRNPRCSPLELPPDKYDQWKRIDFTFDPRDML